MDVILHCSDSSWGNAAMIDGWHRQRGFSNGYGVHIGYHFVILNGRLNLAKTNNYVDGWIETGRPIDDNDKFEWDEKAAATLGKNNCIQICLIGKSGSFTIKQLKSLESLLLLLKKQFHDIRVYQHSDFNPVNKPHCAGFTPKQMLQFNELVKK